MTDMTAKFYLAKFDADDQDTDYLYAIVDDEADDAYMVGDLEDVRYLARILSAPDAAEKAILIDEHDERLGWQWVTVTEAALLAAQIGREYSAARIRQAAANGEITPARLDGKTWKFPRTKFLGWLDNPEKHKRGRK